MNEPSEPNPVRKQSLTAIDGALALIALLLIVQLWLLTVTLELFLTGHREAVLPAALISGALFFCCGMLYLFIHRIDRRAREK